MKRVVVGMATGSLTFIFGLVAVESVDLTDEVLDGLIAFHIRSADPRSVPEVPFVSEEIQSEVIVASLANLSREDHNVTKDGRLYLYISKSVFDRLPNKINGIKLELFEPSGAGEIRHAVTLFSYWQVRNGNVKVTMVSHFYGGNTGGCYLTFSKRGSEWKLADSVCYAMAS